ncbi:MAG: hypothetical protein UT86_C0001G0232 [Candidatus Magasanikbacteria bacterium GW2011_GWC2_40_17]|uniref:Uncharacterized protein n=1 Tax=Candidatus Magasanikbacteria bacterium GW2011_GWA2_42_32 TaxID=1619039 RepID=A0A0G1A9A2_9BACT|nr:MAG: hypothetical protein UT86_C0001G0232 [Candidatus Magasanikbacteria bacterium GW2011_GWC2_40_17]KKS57592.1 MAG: hypothetical protein UV20_C0001G0232 [Candidatus Magasanikbacteria bacterium GW2011_GWA2_42_32]
MAPSRVRAARWDLSFSSRVQSRVIVDWESPNDLSPAPHKAMRSICASRIGINPHFRVQLPSNSQFMVSVHDAGRRPGTSNSLFSNSTRLSIALPD